MEIVELPLNCWEVRKTCCIPIRGKLLKRHDELLVIICKSRMYLLYQFLSNVFKLCIGKRLLCHSYKLIFKCLALVFSCRLQNFVDRTRSTKQIKQETFFNLFCNSLIFQKIFHVKDISWVLSIQRCTNLSTIHLTKRNHWYCTNALKCVAAF